MIHSSMLLLLMNGCQIRCEPIVVHGSVLHRGMTLEYRFTKETFDHLIDRPKEMSFFIAEKLSDKILPMLEVCQQSRIVDRPERVDQSVAQLSTAMLSVISGIIIDYRKVINELESCVTANQAYFGKFLVRMPDPNAVHMSLTFQLIVNSHELHIKGELSAHDEAEYISFNVINERVAIRY